MRVHRSFAIPLLALAPFSVASAPVGAELDTVTLTAGLAGAREVPGPGDQNGSGLARIVVDPAAGSICYTLTVRNIAPATAAHIHVGAHDQSGGVVQGLAPPTDGSSSGCVTNQAVAEAVAANPSGYYVNVHNADFPGGAVRGQLAGPSA